MKVGEPLTRTLTLLAKGTTVGQLPELNAAKIDDQLKTYPDQPVLQEQKKADGLIAFREEKIAIIPSKAGSYKLPAIEIPWFNTQSQKMEIAKIPETTITAVERLQELSPSPQTPAVPAVEQPQKIEAITPITQTQQQNIWLWVSVFLASGWLVTLIYFLTRRPAKKPVVENKDRHKEIRLEDSVKSPKKSLCR